VITIRRDTTATAEQPKIVRWMTAFNGFGFDKWSATAHAFVVHRISQSFVMDLWQTRHGYEWWEKVGNEKVHRDNFVSASDPEPDKPAGQKAKMYYVIPIYSAEIGGRRELMIGGDNPTGALKAFFGEIDDKKSVLATLIAAEKCDASIVPDVQVSYTTGSDRAAMPVFVVGDWLERPDEWGKIGVRFA
jgi:hypothetical protein